MSFLRAVRLERDRVPDFARYPFAIPAIAGLDELALAPKVTLFVGDNRSGKSTLIEANAVACRFNAEGGTTSFNSSTRSPESELHGDLRIARSAKRASRCTSSRTASRSSRWSSTASTIRACTSSTSPSQHYRRSASCRYWP